MDVREKLVELLDEAEEWADHKCDELDCETCPADKMKGNCVQQLMVDRLIAHGVTVQEWYSASNSPKEDGTYLVQTTTGTITTARFYAFKSFPSTKYLPACHRSASWQSNRNVVKWTYLPQPPKGE